MVFDSGEYNSYAVPVHDGYIVQSSIFKSKIAGKTLTDSVHSYLKSQNVEVVPECMLKTVIKNGRAEKEKQDLPGFTDSTQKFHVDRMIKKMKHEVLCISEEPIAKRDRTYGFESKIYWLPDGSAVELKGEQFKIPEMLFVSKSAKKEDIKEKEDEGDAEMQDDDSHTTEGFPGYQNMWHKAINASDSDIRKDLYRNVLCTGGTTQIKNFEKRLKSEIQELAPQNWDVKFLIKTKMPIPGIENDDFHTPWIGASILSSLGSFGQAPSKHFRLICFRHQWFPYQKLKFQVHVVYQAGVRGEWGPLYREEMPVSTSAVA